jgi:hypothetical protein
MDTVSLNLAKIRRRVEVPTSIPGLVTKCVLVMTFLDGVPLTQLDKHTSGLSEAKRKASFRTVRCVALLGCYEAAQASIIVSWALPGCSTCGTTWQTRCICCL